MEGEGLALEERGGKIIMSFRFVLSNELTDEVSLFHKKAVNGRAKMDRSS